MPSSRRRVVDGIRATRSMKRVVAVLLTDASNLHLNTIQQASSVSIGLVTVCTARLESHGWAAGEFIDGPYPRRYAYRLTPHGWGKAYELLGVTPSEVRRG